MKKTIQDHHENITPTQSPASRSLPLRVITATSLFDGHDAAINIMRRVMQEQGAEVIHLGHNRSVKEVVNAALQEDAQAIAVSCYQGGHVEYFQYMMELLKKAGATTKVFGGGGGVIVPSEIALIEQAGVSKIFSPEDGRQMGLPGMIAYLLQTAAQPLDFSAPFNQDELRPEQPLSLARALTAIEYASMGVMELPETLRSHLSQTPRATVPVLGITGTGGAGKSSLVDELVLRFVDDFPEKRVAILSVDPTRARTGGALLGDRIRMNVLKNSAVFMRSLATRRSGSEISAALTESIQLFKLAGFDLILVETAGIGQGDSAIVPLVDLSLYVMTAEFGAASQLEKIDMIDFADIIAINKFDRKGSEDALRAVEKQYQRNHQRFNEAPSAMPVYGTIAARFNDDGVTALYQALLQKINASGKAIFHSHTVPLAQKITSARSVTIPSDRLRYLAEIAHSVRAYHRETTQQCADVEARWHLEKAAEIMGQDVTDPKASIKSISSASEQLLKDYQTAQSAFRQPEYVYQVRDKTYRVALHTASLSGTAIPKIALPRFQNPGEQLRFMRAENFPGQFPFTAGTFPFRRTDEEPARMFAGEGDAARTNARFKLVSANSKAKRLSTAFDSVTLYGCDPASDPDIYGKVGTSGVSICTVEDMQTLYDGFDLCSPNTSVSMTINGPAPIILAFFLNAAINQQVAAFKEKHSRAPTADEYQQIKIFAQKNVRGTVQADILKEDQGQNTCIFGIDFALKMMGDIQEYFVQQEIRNFYSVSISGYHIAEAGANPISQVAFTLANGFTFVEYYLARGMAIDDFAPNLSFFFSLSMDPEYAVINRVARRIWAIAMRDRYAANERSQKLKTHIQTSGRSLHAQEVQFNDIRTTLEALTALYDNCNSLHTNSYDEAITTPTDESVRRALAIQLIINQEYGLHKNENVLQGSFIIDELTDLVEEAILVEFERLSERGGVLGAMELGYQRGKIQEESLFYERQKMSGDYPIVGVNTFINPDLDVMATANTMELRRGTASEKENQLTRLLDFQQRHQAQAAEALQHLQAVAKAGGNVFAELMETVKCCSLGQITAALFQVGGAYRRNM